jgi:hypothetical protein
MAGVQRFRTVTRESLDDIEKIRRRGGWILEDLKNGSTP